MAQASIYTGPSNDENQQPTAFQDIYKKLTVDIRCPVLPNPSPNPYDKALSHAITELHLHPTIEALLHILNNDLPSAHFLCRHMQSPPAYEGMYIHGILHRVEGDYRNTEAWYGDVAEADCFQQVWADGGLDSAKAFVRNVERLRKEGVGDADALERTSRGEFEGLISFCTKKYGLGKMADGTHAWVANSEKISEVASNMLVGGEGWRQF